MYLRGEGGFRVESKPWRERERESKKRNEGWDGIEGWAEDGKEGRASCSSVTRILVPGEAERLALRLLPGPSSPRKVEEERWRGRKREEGGRFRENVVLNGVGVPTNEKE